MFKSNVTISNRNIQDTPSFGYYIYNADCKHKQAFQEIYSTDSVLVEKKTAMLQYGRNSIPYEHLLVVIIHMKVCLGNNELNTLIISTSH